MRNHFTRNVVPFLVLALAVPASAFGDERLPGARPPLFATVKAVTNENGNLELVVRVPVFSAQSRTVTVTTKDPSVPSGGEQLEVTEYVPKTRELVAQFVRLRDHEPPTQRVATTVTDMTGKLMDKEAVLSRLKDFTPVLIARDHRGIDQYYRSVIRRDVLIVTPGFFVEVDALFVDGMTVESRDASPKPHEQSELKENN